MRVLGWTVPHDGAQDAIRIGRVSMILSTASNATPRDHMAEQCLHARHLEAFLPTSPDCTQDQSDLKDWTAAHEAAINARLSALHGAVQVSVRLSRETKIQATAGASWLRARAAHLTQAAKAEALVRETMASLSPLECVAATLRNTLSLSFLLPRARLDEVHAVLNTAGRRALMGWSCAVVAPLPAYHFTDLGPEGNSCKT